MTSEWLAGPGTFWILFGSAAGFSVFYVVLALRLGKMGRSESDGCLLAICNVGLVIVGGAIGYLLFGFPTQLFTAMAGSILLPALMTSFWLHKITRR